MKVNSNQFEERFQNLHKLGEGAYGSVFKVYDKYKKQIIALKKIKLSDQDEGIPATTIREISLLRELSHPNIIQLTDLMYKIKERKLYLLFEYMETDLYQYTKFKKLEYRHIKSIFRQIVIGLDFCHENYSLHRDLKPQNILISKDGSVVKIADFGLARHFSLPFRAYSKEIETLWYRAPEILMGSREYGIGVDIWSLGCVFIQLFTNRPIFQGDCQVQQLMLIFNTLGTPNPSTWNSIEDVPDFSPDFPKFKRRGFGHLIGINDFDDVALDLLEKMLEIDPVKRYGCKEILSHDYFKA